jgi:hypothetical protein
MRKIEFTKDVSIMLESVFYKPGIIDVEVVVMSRGDLIDVYIISPTGSRIKIDPYFICASDQEEILQEIKKQKECLQ